MGYYVETGTNHGKAGIIASMHDGIVYYDAPDYDEETERGNGIIVVIDNVLFEAAGFAFSKEEYEAFTREDGRPKQYVVLPRDVAERISNYG